MSKKVKETDFKALLKSFFGMDNEDDVLQGEDFSEEEYIKKSNEISEQVKEDLINAVVQSATLEAMLDHSSNKKIKREKLNVNGNDKDRTRHTMKNIKESQRRKNENEKEIVD